MFRRKRKEIRDSIKEIGDKRMANITQELLQDLFNELATCEQNAKHLDKLIALLDDPSKKLNREKIDKALAKSLAHSNRTNARLIRLIGFVINPPAKSAADQTMDDIRKKNSPSGDIFSDIFGTKGPF